MKHLQLLAIVAAFILLIGCTSTTGNQPTPPQFVESTTSETTEPIRLETPIPEPTEFTFPLGDFPGEITASVMDIDEYNRVRMTFTTTVQEPYVVWVSYMHHVEKEVSGEWVAAVLCDNCFWVSGGVEAERHMILGMWSEEEAYAHMVNYGFLRAGEIHETTPVRICTPASSPHWMTFTDEPGHYRAVNNVKLMREDGVDENGEIIHTTVWQGEVYAEFTVVE
ncbi:MAG: hypothetical protein FWE06_07655 [Oscillospiraceae bacterium]|nr:hypothetical protein [Oscillospiraceae bacterium]